MPPPCGWLERLVWGAGVVGHQNSHRLLRSCHRLGWNLNPEIEDSMTTPRRLRFCPLVYLPH